MMELYPVKALLTAKEKRYQPVKHYVFIVEVTWSDGSKIPIYRHYSDFAQLHTDLSEAVTSLPEDERKDNQLPIFPAKKVFQRNEIKRNATVRRHAFDDYCMGLLNLDPVISQHKVITEFFKCREGDINPPNKDNTEKSAKKRRPSSILEMFSGLLSGKKSPSSTDIEDEDDPVYVSSPIVCETYLVLADYNAQDKHEIRLTEGMAVEVVEKYDNGWWFVQMEDQFGWAPATYLTPQEDREQEEPEPLYSGNHKYITTDSYTAQDDDELSFNAGVLIKVLHKLLDGWWIVDYKGKVGYAPATYLVPFNNPHYKGTVKYGKSKKMPTKRRTTIKNSKGRTLTYQKKRDMTLYNKFSRQISAQEAKAITERIQAKLSKENEPVIMRSNNITPVSSDEATKDEPELKAEAEDDTTDKNDEEYDYIEENDMEEIQTWVQQIRPRSKSEVPKGYKEKSPVNMSGVEIQINSGSCEDLTAAKPKRMSSLLNVPGFALKLRHHSSENLSSVTAIGTAYNKAPMSPKITKRSLSVSTPSLNKVLSLPKTPESTFRDKHEDISVYSTPLSAEDIPIYNDSENHFSDTVDGMEYNKAPPSSNVTRRHRISTESSDSFVSARTPTPPGMAYVFPARDGYDSYLNISYSRSASPVVLDEPVSYVNGNNTNHYDSQELGSDNSRCSSPPKDESSSKRRMTFSGQERVPTIKKYARSLSSVDPSPTYSMINKVRKDHSRKLSGLNGGTNNNGATVHDVMTTLISALQNKTISSVRTNELGELIVAFNKIEDLKTDILPTMV